MPALAELIGQRAAQLNLGGSWDSSQTLCLPGSQERGDGNSRRPTPPDPCAWIPLQPSVAEHFPLFFEKIQKISHPNESPNEFKALLFVRQGWAMTLFELCSRWLPTSLGRAPCASIDFDPFLR